MLQHGTQEEQTPRRAVVLGSSGFVASHIVEALRKRNVETEAIGRSVIDLLVVDSAAEALAERLRPDDVLVFVAAMAPVKNSSMFFSNMQIVQSVLGALSRSPVSYVLNVSSDAIYADCSVPMTEDDPQVPTALHGMMHTAREMLLAESIDVPIGNLRPTLIYGAADPHNGYGPNRFRRLVQAGEDIVLFGEGEERRDHVHVTDVGELAARMVMHRSCGALNAATGTVTSFREIAERLVEISGSESKVIGSPRNGPMPHNGYRAFDPSATAAAFPDFRYTPLDEGLRSLLAG